MRDGVMVSVTVVTYNHKEYIGECLDSILAQKTHYSYEIIVHDDASTAIQSSQWTQFVI